MKFRMIALIAAFLLLFVPLFAHTQTANCTGWQYFKRIDLRRFTIPLDVNNLGVVVGGTHSDYAGLPTAPAFTRLPDGSIKIFRYNGLLTTFTRRNSVGVAVGYYTGPGGHTHGIVKYGTKVVTFNDPNASDTLPLGINKWGTIVGYYTLPGSIQTHGFKYKNGKFYAVSFPGSTGTRVLSINDNGVMVGDYTHPNIADGFILQNGIFKTFNNPKSTGLTSPEDINNTGAIVGSYVIGVLPHSYIYSNGVFKDINVPNAKPYGQVHGINDHNEVTGEAFTSDGSSGFIAHCQ